MWSSDLRGAVAVCALVVGLTCPALAQDRDLGLPAAESADAGMLAAIPGADAATLDEVARLQAQINVMRLDLQRRQLQLELDGVAGNAEAQRLQAEARRIEAEAAKAAFEADLAQAEARAAQARESMQGDDGNGGEWAFEPVSPAEELLMNGTPTIAEISGRSGALTAWLRLPVTDEMKPARAGAYLIDGLRVEAVESDHVTLVVENESGEAERAIRIDYFAPVSGGF